MPEHFVDFLVPSKWSAGWNEIDDEIFRIDFYCVFFFSQYLILLQIFPVFSQCNILFAIFLILLKIIVSVLIYFFDGLVKCEKHINHYQLPGVPEKTLTGGSCPVSAPTDQERPAGASRLPVEAGSEELPGVVRES